jgi:non-specific serine/threonine protein kinase
MIGRTVLHYRVEERLGAGGMGEVYRARDLRLHRDVALKFLPASRQADPESRARLLAEARAAAALRSPHVAAIFDIEEHEGVLFIVMEYVRGEPLSRWTARGRLSVTDAVSIAMQVAAALDEAHASGLVHRDIKSANIMVDDRGVAKVLDFGLAKHVPDLLLTATHPTGPVTGDGLVLGTLAYMSPEQARNRPVDQRSDLFSLGVVLYEMLAGKLPFPTSSPADVLDAIVHRSPAPLAAAPVDLERIVRRALAKEPNARYQTATELRADLQAFQRTLLSPEEFVGGRAGTPTMVSSSGGGRSGHPTHRIAVLRFANVTEDTADDWIGAGLAETLTSDLKHVHQVTVIGAEQVGDTLRRLETEGSIHDEHGFAIELGRRVGATCLVTGGYQRQDNLLRVTARFVDVETGTVTKTLRVDGVMSQIFELQDQIVHGLSQDLEVRLQSSERMAIEEPETRSVEAYEAYSRGLVELRRAEVASLDLAITLFDRAIRLDPEYASAWAALGAAYDLKAFFSGMSHWSAKAVELEQRALAINPHLSSAHHWLGVAYLNAGRYEEAIEATGTAIRLDPGNALAHAVRGRGLAFGRGNVDEAIAELREAVRIDATLGYAHLLLALLYLVRGQYDWAEVSARRAVHMQEAATSVRGPNVVGAHLMLGLIFYWQGQYEAALQQYEHERAWVASSQHAQRDRIQVELEQKFSAVLWRIGRQEESDRHFQEASRAFSGGGQTRAIDPLVMYGMAALLTLRGDVMRASEYLDEARTRVPAFVQLLLSADPDFQSVREDAHLRAP